MQLQNSNKGEKFDTTLFFACVQCFVIKDVRAVLGRSARRARHDTFLSGTEGVHLPRPGALTQSRCGESELMIASVGSKAPGLRDPPAHETQKMH